LLSSSRLILFTLFPCFQDAALQKIASIHAILRPQPKSLCLLLLLCYSSSFACFCAFFFRFFLAASEEKKVSLVKVIEPHFLQLKDFYKSGFILATREVRFRHHLFSSLVLSSLLFTACCALCLCFTAVLRRLLSLSLACFLLLFFSTLTDCIDKIGKQIDKKSGMRKSTSSSSLLSSSSSTSSSSSSSLFPSSSFVQSDFSYGMPLEDAFLPQQQPQPPTVQKKRKSESGLNETIPSFLPSFLSSFPILPSHLPVLFLFF
jgi:hypothetical protein